jgi:hypothetical protein
MTPGSDRARPPTQQHATHRAHLTLRPPPYTTNHPAAQTPLPRPRAPPRPHASPQPVPDTTTAIYKRPPTPFDVPPVFVARQPRRSTSSTPHGHHPTKPKNNQIVHEDAAASRAVHQPTRALTCPPTTPPHRHQRPPSAPAAAPTHQQTKHPPSNPTADTHNTHAHTLSTRCALPPPAPAPTARPLRVALSPPHIITPHDATKYPTHSRPHSPPPHTDTHVTQRPCPPTHSRDRAHRPTSITTSSQRLPRARMEQTDGSAIGSRPPTEQHATRRARLNFRPPPSTTTHLHTAQTPLPDHARKPPARQSAPRCWLYQRSPTPLDVRAI